MMLVYYAAVDFSALGVLLIGTILAIVFALYSIKQAICHTVVYPIGTRARKGKMYKFQINFAKAFFGDWVIDTEEEEDGTTFILLFKKRFPLWTLMMVTANEINMLVYIAAVFFNAFLIERSKECTSTFISPGFDCFPARGGDFFANPINCSNDFIDYEKLDITCLKFTMNFPFAAGLAGGLLEFFPLLFTIPLYAIVQLSNGNKHRKYIAYGIQWIVLVMIIVFGFVLFVVSHIRDYVIGYDLYNVFTYVSLFAMLLSVLTMPWSLAIQPRAHDVPIAANPDYYIRKAEEGFGMKIADNSQGLEEIIN